MDWNHPGPQLSAHSVSRNINAAGAASVAMVVAYPVTIDGSQEMGGGRTWLQSLDRLGDRTIILSAACADQAQQQSEHSPERARLRRLRMIPDRNSHEELLILAAWDELRQPSTRLPIEGRKHREGRRL
jgi:hypothetical protein